MFSTSKKGSFMDMFDSSESKSDSILPKFTNPLAKPESSISNLNPANMVANAFTEEPACAKCCPKLTFKQRIIGFLACAGFGYLLSFIGTLTLIGGATDENVRTFVALYVVGNVIALFATGFLLGPKTQCRKMWDPTRRYSTAFYLIMLIIVFAVAVAKQNIGLVLVLLVIQIMAALWYSISYIPFGRKAVIAFSKRTICKPCWDLYEDSKGSGGGGGNASA